MKEGREKHYHPWIYKNEISRVVGDFENGDIVDVLTASGRFYGIGYINTNSKITVRLMSFEPLSIEKLLRTRIEASIERRKNLIKTREALRLIFAESDWLPGLIVDKFGNYLVVQINTLGMEKLKHKVFEILLSIFSETIGIYEKSDTPAREKEGLTESTGWIYGSGPEIIYFQSNGLILAADLLGQKTGAFLDQINNAEALRPFAQGKICLDVFSYTGNFALHLLQYGAEHVKLIDYSDRALQIAEDLLKRNGFEGKYELINTNAFDWLKENSKSGEQYDIAVLDPPSFAKTSYSKDQAFRGHKEINLRAIKMLRKPGLLVTCSCTQVISEGEFEQILIEASEDSHAELAVIYKAGQSFDHPYILGIEETRYLKFLICETRRRRQ